MNQSPDVIGAAAKVVAALFFAAAIYLSAVTFANVADMYVRSNAVDECGRMSEYVTSNSKEGSKTSSPVIEIYNTCLKDKGMK